MDVKSVNCDIAKIYIITNNIYFFYGLKNLIFTIMPEILARTSIIYDVELFSSNKHYSLDTKNNKNNYFIMDMESMNSLNSNFIGILLNSSVKKQNVIVFKSINKPSPCEVCFYKRIPLNLLKTQMRDIISNKMKPDLIRQPNTLTKKERLVINYVLMGESMQDIAQKLGINYKTVYTLRSKAYKKFGVNSIQGLYNYSAKMNYL